ncbi:MAG: hypothetical protein OER85_05910 [Gammaproteobacteria bacterium]|nr:hypothetical protein [Gammaproteobacteria bacterium]
MRTISSHLKCTYIVALLGLSVLSPAAMASYEPPGAARSAISVDEVALELSNPATALRSLAIDIEYRTYQGDLPGSDDQSAWRYVLTPSWPFKLSNGKNILLSAMIPVNGDPPTWNRFPRVDYGEFLIRQVPADQLMEREFFSGHAHLDDIGINVGYGGVNEKNGLISMFGLAGVFPTSTDRASSRSQWLLGPEFALGKVTRWGVIGAQANHLTSITGEEVRSGVLRTSIAGNERWNTNETTVKIFFAYGLRNGWQIESNPIVRYDWEAVSGNEWFVPIGAGISKTIMLGSLPLKLAFDIQKFVVSPDRFGPEWQLTVSFAPVISTKLLR